MNDLTPQEQQRLTEKRLKGTITPEEDALLEAWYAKDPGSQMLWESQDPDKEALKNRMFFQIRQGAGLVSSRSRLSRRRIGRLSAAAAVLVVFGMSAYWIYRGHPRQEKITSASLPPGKDIAPGHSGAILTLADGSHIVLDSAGNGKIALQGATRLVKNGNGQLVYEAGKNATGIIAYNTLTTPRGRQYTVVLPDGTTVWLNAASSLTYPTVFMGNERKVAITGEAYFEVAGNAVSPFKVKINNGVEVEVLGTHFNISAYGDEDAIRTTLLEGGVRVNNGKGSVLLSPRDQYKVRTSDGAGQLLNDVDVDGVIAWKNGVFQLDHSNIREVMRQLARWYDVEISYEGPVADRELGGSISRNVNLSNVVMALDAMDVHCRVEGKILIVEK